MEIEYNTFESYFFTIATRVCFVLSIVRPVANVHFHKDDPQCFVYSVMSNKVMKYSYNV